MNTVSLDLPSDRGEDALPPAPGPPVNNSCSGKSGCCREADHDRINGKAEPFDVFREDEALIESIL